MEPVFKAWKFRHGDTPGPFAVRLTGYDIRTRASVPVPRLGDVVLWTIFWHNRDAETRSTDVNGGLNLDENTRFVSWPITAEDIGKISIGDVIPLDIKLRDSDGRITTFLVGTIEAEGYKA